MKIFLLLISFNLFAQDFGSFDNVGLVADLASAHKKSTLIKNLITDFEDQYHCKCRNGISTFPIAQDYLIRTRFHCKELETNKKIKLIVTSEYSVKNNEYEFNLKGIRIKERP